MRRVTVAAVLAFVLVFAAGCGSSSKKSSNSKSSSATTAPKSFQVQTDDGQVSLSLNGQLPPNWPSAFPIPPGATPAGSGSFVDNSSGALVGVYKTSQAPADVYNFYKTNSGLTVTSSSSAGAGSAYAGTVKFGGTYAGSSANIVSLSGTTYVVIVLKPSSTSPTTSVTTTTKSGS